MIGLSGFLNRLCSSFLKTFFSLSVLSLFFIFFPVGKNVYEQKKYKTYVWRGMIVYIATAVKVRKMRMGELRDRRIRAYLKRRGH